MTKTYETKWMITVTVADSGKQIGWIKQTENRFGDTVYVKTYFAEQRYITDDFAKAAQIAHDLDQYAAARGVPASHDVVPTNVVEGAA